MTTTNIGSESNATVDHDPSFSDDEDFEVIGDVPPDSPSPDAVKNNNENAVITSGSPLFLDALNSITSSSQISSEANTSSDVLPETISIWAVPQETGLTSVVAKSPSKISSKEETKEELCQANVLSNTLEASTVTIRECDDKAEGLVEKKEEDDRFLEMLQELDAIKKELECARSALAEKDTQVENLKAELSAREVSISALSEQHKLDLNKVEEEMSSKCSQIAELEKQFADWSVEMEKKNEALRKLSMEYDMLLALKVNAEEVIQKQACALNRLKSSDDCVVPVVVHDQSLLEQLRDKEKQLEVAQLQLAQAREDAERAHLNAANLQAVAKVLESDLNSSMSESDDRIRQLQMQIESLIDRGEVNNV